MKETHIVRVTGKPPLICKSMLLVLTTVLALILCSCLGASIKGVPSGYTSKEEHLGEGWQDYTDYCKYVYRDSSRFTDNSDYKKVSSDEVTRISQFFKNFRSWMETEERLSEYDFDPACIDTEDYYKLEERYPNFEDYKLWFFDTQTLTLYYIHTNI